MMQTRKILARQELESLQKYVRGEVVHEEGVTVLKIENSIGHGNVKCICFDEGFMALEFDIVLHEDCTLSLNDAQKSMVYFLYCLEGNCRHQFKDEKVISKLEKLQTAVVSTDAQREGEFVIRKNERFVLNLIRVDKREYVESLKNNSAASTSKKGNILAAFEREKGFFHLGRINLEIAELIKMLEDAKYVNDLASLMHFEGVCHLILAKQITQFRYEMDEGRTEATMLLKRELNEISVINDFIKEYPEVQHSITNLSSKSGLSAAKLQQGFKFFHNMTVGEFIRDTRLNKAVQLLRTTEMNISEVVYAIGFTSRSYFCKIFKAKYSCNPKRYKQEVFSTMQDEV